MCTVLLRFTPGGAWPVLLAAVRDEFVDRAWDPPGEHWAWGSPGVYGGRDRSAGGTWLALRPGTAAVAALLNGVRLPVPSGQRPSRGTLALAALDGDVDATLDGDDVRDYDGFHLLLATLERAVVWTWDGAAVTRTELAAGDHIVVNAGVDTVDDPLVPHFGPLLARAQSPALAGPTDVAWGDWVRLLRGDGLAPDDPRALLVRRQVGDRTYGSTSASLVALGPVGVRYDFTASPDTPQWSRVDLSG